jgi:hypothetical protein
MKYGMALPNGGLPARRLVELAVLAEESGWDGVFVEDYIMWQGHRDVPTFDPWALLAALAMATDRLKLSIQVTPLARRRPWKVAAEALRYALYDARRHSQFARTRDCHQGKCGRVRYFGRRQPAARKLGRGEGVYPPITRRGSNLVDRVCAARPS